MNVIRAHLKTKNNVSPMTQLKTKKIPISSLKFGDIFISHFDLSGNAFKEGDVLFVLKVYRDGSFSQYFDVLWNNKKFNVNMCALEVFVPLE